MSMSRGCLLVEYAVGEWYCIVAIDEHDYEFSSFEVFGPGETEDEAFDKMHRECCNPGSSTTVTKENITEWEKEVIEKKYK